VRVVHEVVRHASAWIFDVPVASTEAKFNPEMVTCVPPDAAAFVGNIELATGESNEKPT